MELQELKVTSRTAKGKGPARRVRSAGEVPGIVYGGDGEPVQLQANARALHKLLHAAGGEHAIVQLRFDGDSSLDSPALVKEVQHHPVKGHVLHADFMRIRLDEKITTSVPIKLVGNPVGVVNGGVLDVQLREVEIQCLALEVPEFIELDISGLEIGASVHVDALVPPAGIDIVSEGERTIAAIHAPRVAKESAEGEVEAGEVPEVGKEKADDGGEG